MPSAQRIHQPNESMLARRNICIWYEEALRSILIVVKNISRTTKIILHDGASSLNCGGNIKRAAHRWLRLAVMTRAAVQVM